MVQIIIPLGAENLNDHFMINKFSKDLNQLLSFLSAN